MDMLSGNDPFFENDPFENEPFLDELASALELEDAKKETPPTEPPREEIPLPEFNHLNDYLAYARQLNASDLHIGAAVRPFMRHYSHIEPINVDPLFSEETQCLLFEILNEEQQNHLVKHQSLEFSMNVPGQGRYRCSIIKQRLGWDGNFRIIQNTVPTFEDLGLPEALKRLTEYPQGLVLITGPANSGKTTTLAALIDMINTKRTDHVITIEYPIEYVHTPKQCQITQREVGNHTESFAEALRAALRQDPDIIMVGELRDLQTISMAISASETGHLVFGTLHTTSAARTINKILDGFPISQQAQIRTMVSESLRGVISQQLLPRQDGQGIALAMEILFVTTGVSALLRDNKTLQIPSIIQTSRRMGMCLMDDSLQNLVDTGIIDPVEAYRYIENKEKYEHLKKGDPSPANSSMGYTPITIDSVN